MGFPYTNHADAWLVAFSLASVPPNQFSAQSVQRIFPRCPPSPSQRLSGPQHTHRNLCTGTPAPKHPQELLRAELFCSSQALPGCPTHIGPYLIGSKLHSCFPFHQSCADLHDYRLDGVCAAPALRDRAHTAGRSAWMGAWAEPPRGRGRPSPSPMQAAQALSCRQEQDLASRGESSKPGTRLRALGLTCLVSSSMQMAPPPRTYLGEGIWAKLCQRWTQPCPPPALQESCLLQPKEKNPNKTKRKEEKPSANRYLPPRQHWGHNPYKWWIERKVILEQEKGRKRIEERLLWWLRAAGVH